jgi:uncharacterized protein (TIGR03435 family)
MVPRLLIFVAFASVQPAFEVVSVRPSIAAVPGPLSIRIDGAQFTARNITVLGLALRAFRVTSCSEEGQYGCSVVAGGPDWIKKDRFDIQAKIPDDTPAYDWTQLMNGQAAEVARMIEGLLTDRFRFQAHHETREMPIYALTVSPKGHKLGQPEASSAASHILVSPSEANGERSFQFEALHSSMKDLCDFFSSCMKRPMIDRSGLVGKFHVTLNYDANPLTPGDFTELAGPELFRAMQDQLGLKVEAKRGPVEILVIDHAERPAAQ